MTTRSWLTRLFAPRRLRTIRMARPRCRPTLEPLEKRWLPAITVNTLADTFDGSITDGTISLRDAIANCPAGGVINFSVHGTINLALGELVLQNVDLEGPGTSLLTFNANGHSRVFDTSGTTTIAGVTITGGNFATAAALIPGGGGILNECKGANAFLMVRDSVLTGNTAGPASGGGIASTTNVNGAGPGSYASVTVVNSTISGNTDTASDFGGGGLSGSYGGGIYGSYSLITVVNSTISGNSANQGSAIYCRGGAITMANSTVSNNLGDLGCIDGAGGTISNSTIADNQGYAIRWESGVVANSTIADNGFGINASHSPNAPTTALYNSIFVGNGHDIDGYVDPGSRNNLIGDGNVIDGVEGGLVNGVNGNMVGVYDPGIGPLANNGGPTETCALFSYSPAINAGDNALIPIDPVGGLPLTTDQTGAPRVFGGTVDIGAAELEGTPVPSLVVNTAADNVAPDALTSLREAVEFADREGGTVTFDPAVFATPQALPLVFGPILVNGNGPVTLAGPGAGLATVDAGGLSQDFLTTGTATISGLTITGGQAVIPQVTNKGAVGNHGTLVIRDCVIRDNSNSGVFNLGSLTIENSIISDNTTVDEGGGIYSNDHDNSLDHGSGASVTISNSTITGNSAVGGTNGGGGGIYSKDPLSIVNSTISGNWTLSAGGGVYATATATIVNSTIAGNFAAGAGGMELLDSPTIINSTISGNTATAIGGLHLGEFATIMNSTIANNSATSFWGGITGGPGAVTLLDSIVSGNLLNGTPDDLYPGSASSASVYSLIGNAATAGGLVNGVNGNIVGVDPLLGPLADNGGPTQTQALLPGSPARNAGDPALPPDVPTDQRGRPRVQGSRMDIGAVEMAAPVTVVGVQVNDGSAQRSEVRSLTVTFSDVVSFFGGSGNAAAAFLLSRVGGGGNVGLAAAVSLNASGQTVVVLTFTNANTAVIDPVSGGPNYSLADGRYQLIIAHTLVTSEAGALDGDANGTPGGNYVSPTDTLGGGPGQLHLYRLFGDATGDGIVDQLDLAAFRATNNSSSPDPAYVAFLDADNSGTIDQVDLGQFRERNNSSVFPTGPVVTPGGGGGHQSPSATPPPPVGPAPFGMPDTLPTAAPVPIAAPAAVTPIGVNDGNTQPSGMRSIKVSSSGLVTLAGGIDNAAAASQLVRPTDSNDISLTAVSADSEEWAVATLTFSGAEAEPLSRENGGVSSLADGRHQLVILSGSVTGTNGVALNGRGPSGNYVSPGDAAGDGIVDQIDLGQLQSTFNANSTGLFYLSFLDAAGNAVVDAQDLGTFHSWFNANVF